MKTDIREYAEDFVVEVIEMNGRQVIKAMNQGGYDCTLVDLQDVIDWYESHK